MSEQIKKKCAIFVISNIMCIVCCIPIFTAGAALCTLYSITFRLAKDDLNFNIFSLFIKKFRKNIKRTILPWTVIAILLGFMISDVYLCQNMTNWIAYLRFPIYVLLAILILMTAYFIPLLSQFEMKRGKIMLNCFFFIFSSPLKAVFILLIHVVPIYLTVSDPLLRIPLIIIWILFGVSLLTYITSILLQSEIDKLYKK